LGIGIDAVCIGLQVLTSLRVSFLQVVARHLHKAYVSHLQVGLQCGCAEHLANSALNEHLFEVEGEESVLGLRVAQSEEQIGVALGVDVRNALAISENGEAVGFGRGVAL